MATVELDRVSKGYSGQSMAVDGISLKVEDRELVVLVGPSGCGKSTTLRLIAGLEQADSGELRIDGRRVNETAAKDRDLAMVFQNYALYPHMSVYKNLAFGLELRFGGGVCARVLRRIFHPRQAAELAVLRRGVSQRVQQAAGRLGIDHLLGRRPHELSGGERQRVALGRAIVRNPAAFLFDEPLSNLDAQLRTGMRSEIRRLQQELQATMIYVTHDQVEAMTLGDRIAVMNRGRIEQIGSPQEVYFRPANRFVAEFLGATPMNFLAGRWRREGMKGWFEATGSGWSLEVGDAVRTPGRSPNNEFNVVWGIRPEHLRLRPWRGEAEIAGGASGVGGTNGAGSSATGETPGAECPVALGRVVQTEWVGEAGNCQVELFNASSGAVLVVVRTLSSDRWNRGQLVAVEFETERIVWFDPVSGANLQKE